MITVNQDKCDGCGICVAVCPVGAPAVDDSTKKSSIDPDLCIECLACVEACPSEAIFDDQE